MENWSRYIVSGCDSGRVSIRTEGLELFEEQLKREWAIETGIIERVYTLDRGITKLLIERGIDASLIPRSANAKSPELVARIIADHADVLEGLFAFVKGERDLSVGYIKELHAALLRHQDTLTVVDQFGERFEKHLQKGTYKSLSNNPTRVDGVTHEHCPPEHVASEMDRMIALHTEHVAKDVPVEIEAAWLHHVFAQIHPFEDGNGRVARAIASLVFMKADWFPLVITDDERVKYLDALEAADAGNLRDLVSLFVLTQRRLVIRAAEVKTPKTVAEAIAATRELLIKEGNVEEEVRML